MNRPAADCTLESWRRVIEVNLTGVFLGMKYAIPEMLKGGGGSIINNASVAGLVGFAGSPAYCASKGGVVQLTKCAAMEYAKQGIRVNAICPGVVWTPMVERATGGSAETEEAFKALEPVGRFGTPEEIARMALFLASDDSAFWPKLETRGRLPSSRSLMVRHPTLQLSGRSCKRWPDDDRRHPLFAWAVRL